MKPLIALHAAWPAGVVLIHRVSRIRKRFMLLSAAGWFGSLAIATTGQPPGKALPAGLAAGTAASLVLWCFVIRGVTFTFASDKTYWVDEARLPRGELLAAAFVGAVGLAAAAALVLHASP
ncbi:MAG: hypothetical protein QOH50_3624 [Kribbellaceae bacterium]|nr:hypothetical protein [Kribbellaceae bacterium]